MTCTCERLSKFLMKGRYLLHIADLLTLLAIYFMTFGRLLSLFIILFSFYWHKLFFLLFQIVFLYVHRMPEVRNPIGLLSGKLAISKRARGPLHIRF